MIKDFKIFENHINIKPDIKASVVIIENEIGEILILKRSSKSRLQGWCLPGGRVEKGESIRKAAIRESEEETGISLNKERIKFIGIGYSVKGFQVAIYYSKLLKKEKVKLSVEHDDYAWTKEPEKFKMAGNTLNYIKKVKNIENIFESAQFDKMNDIQILYDIIDEYKIIFLIDDNKIVGFVNDGMQTTTMEEKGVHCIGTIWGPGYGDLLVALAISKFGPLVPSANVSDRAKESYKRRLKDTKFIKYKIKGIGIYGKKESYLNTIFDLDPETKQFLREKIKKNDNEELREEVRNFFFNIKDEYYRNYRKYYTVGKSKYSTGIR